MISTGGGMAEILLMSGNESSGNKGFKSRTTKEARRRRMELRRFKIIEDPPPDSSAGEVDEPRMKKRIPEPVVPFVGELVPLGPNRAKDAERGRRCPGYGMTSVCGRRREMEDAVSIRPAFLRRRELGFHFFGVFDGHGCSHVAASCKERLHEIVAEEVAEEQGRTPVPAEWRNVMERSFSRIDTEMLPSPTAGQFAGGSGSCKCVLQSSMNDHVGSTAVALVVSPEHVVVANCGDSRAVLCRNGVAVPLSSDHKPDRPDELQRIQEAGGRVIYWDGARVLGVLAMSRAIGDKLLKPFVTEKPEVTVTERSDEDEFVVLASDGLWDVVSNATACEVVKTCFRCSSSRGEATGPSEDERDKQGGSDKVCVNAAVLLTNLAIARMSADNISVVVVDLRRR